MGLIERDVTHSGTRQLLFVECMAPIQDEGMTHPFCDTLPVEIAVFTPLCNQNQRIAALGYFRGVLAELHGHVGMLAAKPFGSDGIVRFYTYAAIDQLLSDFNGSGFAEIVGVWLEGQAKQPDGPAFQNFELIQ